MRKTATLISLISIISTPFASASKDTCGKTTVGKNHFYCEGTVKNPQGSFVNMAFKMIPSAAFLWDGNKCLRAVARENAGANQQYITFPNSWGIFFNDYTVEGNAFNDGMGEISSNLSCWVAE